MGHWCDEGERARAIGLVERQRQRDRAAERMADDHRATEPHRPDRRGERRGLSADASGTSGRTCRIARTRPVEGDNAKVAGEAIDQRMGEIPHLALKAVDQDQGLAGARVEDMDFFAVEGEKTALRRDRALDPTRRQDGKLDKAANEGQSQQQHDRDRQSHYGVISRESTAV